VHGTCGERSITTISCRLLSPSAAITDGKTQEVDRVPWCAAPHATARRKSSRVPQRCWPFEASSRFEIGPEGRRPLPSSPSTCQKKKKQKMEAATSARTITEHPPTPRILPAMTIYSRPSDAVFIATDGPFAGQKASIRHHALKTSAKAPLQELKSQRSPPCASRTTPLPNRGFPRCRGAGRAAICRCSSRPCGAEVYQLVRVAARCHLQEFIDGQAHGAVTNEGPSSESTAVPGRVPSRRSASRGGLYEPR